MYDVLYCPVVYGTEAAKTKERYRTRRKKKSWEGKGKAILNQAKSNVKKKKKE